MLGGTLVGLAGGSWGGEGDVGTGGLSAHSSGSAGDGAMLGGPPPSPAHPVPSVLPNRGVAGLVPPHPLLEHLFQLQLRTTVLRAPKSTYSLGGHRPPWHMHSAQGGHHAWGDTERSHQLSTLW